MSDNIPSDLGLVLDKDCDKPLWLQIRDHVIDCIASGVFEPEQRMPPVRDLAAALDISVSVANQAYRYLRLVGYLETKQGSGTRVRRRTDQVDDEDSEIIGTLTGEYVDKMVAYGIPIHDVPNTVSYYIHWRELHDRGDAV